MANTERANEIGLQFSKFYYENFQNKSVIATLYVDSSCLTFEGQTFVSREKIMQKLKELPFKTVTHVVSTCDSQYIFGADGEAVLVTVNGQMKTDDDAPHGFNQTFVLSAVESSYAISNEIFRLSLHQA
ncbi:nuclear transport factor 2-like [Styela clava]